MLEQRPAPDTDHLFSPGNFLIDANADSLADDIRARIILEDEPDAEIWSALFDLAARFGLETSGFTPPLIVDDPLPDQFPIVVRHGRSIRPHFESNGWRGRPAIVLEGADAIRDLALRGQAVWNRGEPVDPEPEPIDLAHIFDATGLLSDSNGDEIPDGTRLCVIVPDELPRAVGVGLFHFITRLALESSGIDLPIATTQAVQRNDAIPLRLNVQDGYLARLSSVDDPNEPALELFGDQFDVANLLERLTVQWPVPPTDAASQSVEDMLQWLRHSLAGWTPEGRVAALVAGLAGRETESEDATIRLLSANDAEQTAQARAVRDLVGQSTSIVGPGPARYAFMQEWSARWEVDRTMDVLREDVLPRLDRKAPLSLTVTVSEPFAVRQRLKERIERELSDSGFNLTNVDVRVLDAFKAGLCWLNEIVLPEWKQAPGIYRISLGFRPLEIAASDNCLDMRIRWLQELFPIDEIIARELELPLERIELTEQPGPPHYTAEAFDEQGNLLMRRDFTPLWTRRPYLDPFPDAGSVHLVTGGIQATQSGTTLTERVPTDAERFWDYLQEEVLPRVQQAIMEATDGAPKAQDQPFFDELLIELTMSETNEPFRVREEMCSAAEALHEDIYFNILDFVETLGTSTTGERLSAPGGVVPIVHVRPGMSPHARVQLRRRARSIARIETGDRVTPIGGIRSVPPAAPIVTSVAILRDQAQLQLRWPSLSSDMRARLKALSELIPGEPHFPALIITSDDGFQVAMGWPPKPSVPAVSAASGRVSSRQFLNGTSLAEQIERLAGYPEVHVNQALDFSYQGRPIPAIEVVAPMSARVWSKRKLSIFKPTFQIVARHHANEVASTTAAIQLVELLVTDTEWHRLLSRVNLAILPFENPDGAALHDRLQREHPTWKHHPARYNAVGYEFGEDHFNPDTRFGESRVRQRLWRTWLPDIIVDNHGVPSHEWAQTFAGFGSPPRFHVSYWQVQAMIYGILYHLESDDFPEHRLAAYALRDSVARAVASDAEMLQWNRRYRERYITWGNRWVPDRFPATTHREMIFYFGGVQPDANRTRRSPAARFPHVTVASWVTEVPDETAHGEHLRLTAKAHLIANRATIDLLAASATPPERRILQSDAGTRIMLGRRRPIIIGP